MARLGAGLDHRETCIGIDPHQIQCRIQIAFIDADIHRHALVTGNGSHPVNEERFCHRIGVGRKYHQGIYICYCRAHKAVAAGQDLFDHAFPLLYCDLHQIPSQRTFLILSENAPAPAGYQAVFGFDIIKTA